MMAGKISEDLSARIDAVRGPMNRSDWQRGALAFAVSAAQSDPGLEFPDWERRARVAEEALDQIRDVLARAGCISQLMVAGPGSQLVDVMTAILSDLGLTDDQRRKATGLIMAQLRQAGQ
jgi:hypothetical protein